jgi:hypothetical protein
MKKWGLLVAVVLLTACSDQTERESVAQVIPKEQKEVIQISEPAVTVHTPISTTTGYVVDQHDRDKWLLVNATDVSGHPHALIENEWMTVGEIEGIDVERNIAIIHFRNSYDFSPLQLVDEPIANGIDLQKQKMSYYETQVGGNTILATSQQIQTLLTETQEKTMTWQQRYEKNMQLQQNQTMEPVNNYTSHYEKNIFTYNPDVLKHFVEQFVVQLNKSVQEKDWSNLVSSIGSDELLEELIYVKEHVEGYEIKEAKKEGVYYFVNGIDGDNKEVRFTIIRDQDHYRVIGTNLIDSNLLREQKVATIDLSHSPLLEEIPALSMFINKHLNEVKLKNEKGEWHLKRADKKIKAQFNDGNQSMNLSCTKIEIEQNSGEKVVQLSGCEKSKDTMILGYIQ